jgi:hypothetical protein
VGARFGAKTTLIAGRMTGEVSLTLDEAIDLCARMDSLEEVVGAPLAFIPVGNLANAAAFPEFPRSLRIVVGLRAACDSRVTSFLVCRARPRFQRTSGDQIMHAISDVATNPGIQWIQQTGPEGSLFTRADAPATFLAVGQSGGIGVAVVIEPAGEGIITGFPTGQ